MPNSLHQDQTPADGIHVVHSVEVADAAARTAYSSTTTASDVGRYVRQVDTGFFYMVQVAGAADMTQVVPPVGGAPSGPAGGDLDQTFPNPNVVAMQTTDGGGTRLVIAGIGDGQFLSRSGGTVVGIDAPSVVFGASVGMSSDQTLSNGSLTSWTLDDPVIALDPLRFALGTSLGVDYIEVVQAGDYAVTICVDADVSLGTSRRSVLHGLYIDALGDDTWLFVDKTQKGTYHRNPPNGENGTSSRVIIAIPAGARISGASQRVSGIGSVILRADGCCISIERVE